MKFCSTFILICIFSIIFVSCYAPRSAEQRYARDLQSHKKVEDSSFAYQLPFNDSTSHRMIQGYYSRYTHKFKAAVDFRMKIGTPVLASRDGIVVRLKEDSDKGGFNKKYRPDANYVVIEHADGSRANYRHLHHEGVEVHIGEKVTTGQLLGFSGNTGYTFSPHLHFMITKEVNGQWVSVPCRFKSKITTGYLKPWHSYTSVNKNTGTVLDLRGESKSGH